MDCPACKAMMIVLEHEAVEVDYCLECGGVWLDAGEMELLFGDAEKCAAFLSIGSPAEAKGEKPRRCPICRAKMSKEATRSKPAILFDHCTKGCGLWFDKGELSEALEGARALGAEGTVPDFLREMLGKETKTKGDL